MTDDIALGNLIAPQYWAKIPILCFIVFKTLVKFLLQMPQLHTAHLKSSILTEN